MANINSFGYEKLRSFILSNWTYLELRTPTGVVLKRFGVADGLTIAGNATTPTIEYKIVVKGDATFLNQEVGKCVLFDVAIGGTPIAEETFTSFTFESAEDELTIIHRLQVPQMV